MEKSILEYRKKLRKRHFIGLLIYVVLILLCVMTLFLLTTAVIGWCQEWKVVGKLAHALLLSLIVMIIVVATLAGVLMMSDRKRYRIVLARLDMLLLRIKLNNESDHATGWVERELQLITRILAS